MRSLHKPTLEQSDGKSCATPGVFSFAHPGERKAVQTCVLLGAVGLQKTPTNVRKRYDGQVKPSLISQLVGVVKDLYTFLTQEAI